MSVGCHPLTIRVDILTECGEYVSGLDGAKRVIRLLKFDPDTLNAAP